MSSKSTASHRSNPKRAVTREKRRQQQRRQRFSLLLIIAGVALLVVGLLVLPAILNAVKPVGDITLPTAVEHPQVNGRALGDPNAPVTLEVFEDFQCPACQGYSFNIEPLIINKYIPSGQVNYIYRLYPFLDDQSVSKESDQAANAAMCAADQERFWDYHDILFANWNGENAGAFRDKRLLAFGEKLNLDMAAFKQCFNAKTHQDVIDADIARGLELNVSGTPTIVVAGQVVGDGSRVPSFEEIGQAIEAALAK